MKFSPDFMKYLIRPYLKRRRFVFDPLAKKYQYHQRWTWSKVKLKGEFEGRNFLSSTFLPPAKKVSGNEGGSYRKSAGKFHSTSTFLEYTLEVILVLCRFIVIVSIGGGLLAFYAITRFVKKEEFPKLLLAAIEALGPTFVKFGQWVSTRRDLFPEEVCKTLESLQRDTMAHSWFYTKHLLELSYGEKWDNLFLNFASQDPIGSGCCAQVYKAFLNLDAAGVEATTTNRDPKISRFAMVLEFLHFGRAIGYFENVQESDNNGHTEKNLRPVAIKVLHPGIEARLKRDLAIMRFIVNCAIVIVPSLRWLSLPDCLDEFSRLMENQVDMELEAFNLQKFSRNFAYAKNVVFPYPYVKFTNKQILVESFHEGTPISRYLDSDDCEFQRELAKLGIATILKMVFHDRFVHCDLHPGNILVQEGSRRRMANLGFKWLERFRYFLGYGPRLVILDCGLTATLSERCRRNLQNVFRCVATGKGEQAGEYIMRHSTHMTSDPVGFKTTLGNIVNEHLRNRLDLNNVNVGTVVTKLFSAMVRYQVKQDGSFSNVILGMAVIEGLGRSLDPNIDIIMEILPFVFDSTHSDD